MIDFDLNDDHVSIRNTVREWAQREVAPHIKEWDERQQFNRAFLDKMAELNLLGVCIPEEYGGAGFDYVALGLVCEELEAVDTHLRVIMSVHTGLNSMTLYAWGTEEQKRKYLVPQAKGEKLATYGLTEPGAGSDVVGSRSTARRDGDGYVLNGVKWHVTSANKADYAFFQAKLAEGPHAGAHAMFIVDLDTPGVRFVRTPAYSHSYSSHHPIIAFDDVRVPATQLVGDEGEGMRFAYEWFRYERLMIAARCCGAAERLVEEASAFAQHRTAFGNAISSYQAIQFMLADSLTELLAARLMTFHAAGLFDAGADPKIVHGKTSMAKLYASEMAGRVADRALQVFGGRGYMTENPVERYYRELRVDRIWEGTSEIQRGIIATRGLGLPRG